MAEPAATLLAVELRPERGAPAIARQLATATCQANGIDPEACHTAALLISELVTNAVIHARTSVRLELHQTTPRLWVGVTDQDEQSQVEIQHSSPIAAHGRGLQIVDNLALDWGVERTDSTKTVWFELDVSPTQAQPAATEMIKQANSGPDREGATRIAARSIRVDP